MRFLCVCQDGNVRSVAMAHRLHNHYGQEAVPVGWNKLSAESLAVFCAWADVVVVMQPEYLKRLPPGVEAKARVVDVGRDRYGAKIHPDLARQVTEACEAWRAAGEI